MVVSILYHAMAAFFAAVLLRNFLKTKNIQLAILYAVVLVPFVLRVLRLK